MDENDDEKILEQMRISEADLRDLFQKFNNFLNTLNPHQRRLYRNSEVTLRHAASTLDDVSPEELKQFLEKYAPEGGVILYVCRRLHRKHDRED
jgi:hypothetical protein